jgi:hypothetical protein
MYPNVLLLHSWIRWAVILLGLVATLRAISGAMSGRSWLPADARLSRIFVGVLDLQMLVGLVLYFALSPITKAALSDFGGAMGERTMRFWAVEHVFGMLAGVALAHVGVARASRTQDGALKHRRIATFFVLALIAILASVPWPGSPHGRPLIRW